MRYIISIALGAAPRLMHRFMGDGHPVMHLPGKHKKPSNQSKPVSVKIASKRTGRRGNR